MKADMKNMETPQEGKELKESALTDVAGGGGHPWDPDRSSKCWYEHNGGSEMRDGAYRKKCRAPACVALANIFGGEGTGWYMCKCHGTERCIDGWHYEGGDW